jgi:hypothetical protein
MDVKPDEPIAPAKTPEPERIWWRDILAATQGLQPRLK